MYRVMNGHEALDPPVPVSPDRAEQCASCWSPISLRRCSYSLCSCLWLVTLNNLQMLDQNPNDNHNQHGEFAGGTYVAIGQKLLRWTIHVRRCGR